MCSVPHLEAEQRVHQDGLVPFAVCRAEPKIIARPSDGMEERRMMTGDADDAGADWLGEIIFHFSRFYFIEKSLLGRKVNAQNNNKKNT